MRLARWAPLFCMPTGRFGARSPEATRWMDRPKRDDVRASPHRTFVTPTACLPPAARAPRPARAPSVHHVRSRRVPVFAGPYVSAAGALMLHPQPRSACMHCILCYLFHSRSRSRRQYHMSANFHATYRPSLACWLLQAFALGFPCICIACMGMTVPAVLLDLDRCVCIYYRYIYILLRAGGFRTKQATHSQPLLLLYYQMRL